MFKFTISKYMNETCARIINATLTLKDAKIQCSNDDKCIAIINKWCDNEGIFQICEKMRNQSDSDNCVYTKTNGNFFLRV